jgi:uncharacterized small protein (DUF1192 family)
MAFDPFAAEEQPRQRPSGHEVGQDLSMLSIGELDERIAMLEGEILRLQEARKQKEASRDAASAFFRSGTG